MPCSIAWSTGIDPLSWTLLRLVRRGVLMAKTHSPYAPEFRRQIVELIRAGRTPEELAREFEPSSRATGRWVAAADRSEGRFPPSAPANGALSAAEREELGRLRRENKQLRLERDILSRATAWF